MLVALSREPWPGHTGVQQYGRTDKDKSQNDSPET